MRFMCSINKATVKNTEYVTRIAVPLQQLSHENTFNITFVRKLSVLLSNRYEPRSIRVWNPWVTSQAADRNMFWNELQVKFFFFIDHKVIYSQLH